MLPAKINIEDTIIPIDKKNLILFVFAILVIISIIRSREMQNKSLIYSLDK
jgi:hypothetical protein